MKGLKRAISSALSIIILSISVICVFGVDASAGISLSDEQLKAKNYPLPKGYAVKTVFATYDTASERGEYTSSLYSTTHSTQDGTFYDKGSIKITTANAAREMGAIGSKVTFDGDGIMFWYKCDYSVDFRLRTNSNEILNYGYLPACPEGQWVTYYYYGAVTNIVFNSSSSHKDIRNYVNNPDITMNFNVMFGTSEERSVYIDEIFTFDAVKTAADTYENDEQVLKYSLNGFLSETKALHTYEDDGSVTVTSAYGEAKSNSPFSITYLLDSTRFKKAVEIANNGSGYIQFPCQNISCHNSNGEDAFCKISVTINGTEKKLVKYNFGAGSEDSYLINVSDIEKPEDATSITIAVTGSSVIDVSLKFKPISVFHFEDNEMILQAEELSPVHTDSSGTVTDAKIFDEDGNNRRYVYAPSTSGGSLSFTLPNMGVGEYDVYASCYVTKSYNAKYNFCINNLKQINNVSFTDPTYVTKQHNANVSIGKLKITKSFDDGASVMMMKCIPKGNEYIYIDYFSFTKTDSAVETEPASNFVVKPYPEMDNYEVKSVLNTFDTYICGSDDRYYESIQVAGYVGDGNAFNLNSRGTVGKGWFDNNGIWSGSNGLDGRGLRFWYRFGGSATLQFNNSTGNKYNQKISANTVGGWYTLYFTSLTENGDLSNITNISLKTDSGAAYYIDEIHTIQEKSGEIKYALNGDGTASVTGYNLRLDDVTIESTYQGCPVTTIKEGALSNTNSLKSIVLPDSITTIEKDAFKNDLNLLSVTFGSGIKNIGENAFLNCEKLGDTIMPASLESVDDTAFDGCAALIMVVKNDTYIKNYAIERSFVYRCSLNGFMYLCKDESITIESYSGGEKALNIPETIDDVTVTVIGENAVSGNTAVTQINIADSVKVISAKAFSGCTALKTVKLSCSLESLGESAFSGCTALSAPTLNEGLTTVSKNAFCDCTSIERLALPASITEIDKTAFDGCVSLVAVVEKGTYAYQFVNENSILQIPDTDSLYKYSVLNYEATVINYTGTESTLLMPSVIDDYKVIAIGNGAFSYNTKIKYVYFPDYCKTICENAFLKCTALTGFSVNDVRSIKAYAFGYCTALVDVKLTNVVSYSEYAFAGCTKLKLEVEQTQFKRTAMELCNSWHVGFNLGNTFDAINSAFTYGMLTPTEQETLWGAPVTTRAMIDFLADGGFDVLRLPVSWSAFIDDSNNYKIDEAYFARIKEIIDWAIADKMYVVLNVHHDTTKWLNLANYSDETCEKFRRVWEQISTYFKDYDEHLIFESLNEARYNEDWDGNSQSNLFSKFNNLQKIFYNTVRVTGGHNDVRYLMFETYGAQAKQGHCSSVWYPSLDEDDHIMMSTHFYTNNIGEGNFSYNLGICKKYFTDKGIPCVLGETGMQNYDPFYDDEHSRWADAVMNVCEDCGMKILFWDDHGGFAMFKRVALEWMWPTQIKTIMEHAYAKEEVKDPVETIFGDVNDDKTVDIKDVLTLKRFLAGITVTFSQKNADANADNDVNAADVLIIKQYLAGYDIKLGKTE